MGIVRQVENTSIGAGSPAALTLKRFGHFNGSIKRDGVALGNVVSAEITYSNNLDRIETIRSAVDRQSRPTSLSGMLTARG